MDIAERINWLSTLTEVQLRALACQNKVVLWKTATVDYLVDTLMSLEELVHEND